MSEHDESHIEPTPLLSVRLDHLQDVLAEHRQGQTVCIAELHASEEGVGILFTIGPQWSHDPNGPIVTGILMQMAYEVNRAATNRLERGSAAEAKMLEAQLAMLDAATEAGLKGGDDDGAQ